MTQENIQRLPEEIKSRLRSDIQINTITQCVTELVFNSLDAKSNSIAIRLNLPTHRIQVIDNGEGITLENFENIGIRYATNKCHVSLDKFERKHKTFGFKGESLASIIAISRKVQISSRFNEINETHLKTFFRGVSEPLINTKNRPSKGTTVTVEDFLYNCPVRQKRINKIDLNNVKIMLERLTIIFPNVSFSLKNEENDEVILTSHKEKTVSHVLCSLNNTLDINKFSEIKVIKGDVKLSGVFYMTSTSITNMQYIFVNKFPVQLDSVQKLFKKSLFNKLEDVFLTQKAYPIYVINIQCPYSEVDICFDSTRYIVEFKSWRTIKRCVEKVVTLYIKKYNKQVENTQKSCETVRIQENSMLSQSSDKVQIKKPRKTLGIKFGFDTKNNENKRTIIERPKVKSKVRKTLGLRLHKPKIIPKVNPKMIKDKSPKDDLKLDKNSPSVCLANIRNDGNKFLGIFDDQFNSQILTLRQTQGNLIKHDESEGKKIILDAFMKSLSPSQEFCENKKTQSEHSFNGNKSTPSSNKIEETPNSNFNKDISLCLKQNTEDIETKKRRIEKLNSVGTGLIEKRLKLQNSKSTDISDFAQNVKDDSSRQNIKPKTFISCRTIGCQTETPKIDILQEEIINTEIKNAEQDINHKKLIKYNTISTYPFELSKRQEEFNKNKEELNLNDNNLSYTFGLSPVKSADISFLNEFWDKREEINTNSNKLQTIENNDPFSNSNSQRENEIFNHKEKQIINLGENQFSIENNKFRQQKTIGEIIKNKILKGIKDIKTKNEKVDFAYQDFFGEKFKEINRNLRFFDDDTNKNKDEFFEDNDLLCQNKMLIGYKNPKDFKETRINSQNKMIFDNDYDFVDDQNQLIGNKCKKMKTKENQFSDQKINKKRDVIFEDEKQFSFFKTKEEFINPNQEEFSFGKKFQRNKSKENMFFDKEIKSTNGEKFKRVRSEEHLCRDERINKKTFELFGNSQNIQNSKNFIFDDQTIKRLKVSKEKNEMVNLNEEEILLENEFERNKKKEIFIYDNNGQKINESNDQVEIISLNQEEFFLRNEFERNKKKEVLIHENKDQKLRRSKGKNEIINLNQEFLLKNDFERNQETEFILHENNDQKIKESNDQDELINLNQEEFFLGNKFEGNKKKKVLIHENKDQKVKRSQNKNQIINLKQELLLKSDFERNKKKGTAVHKNKDQKIKELKEQNEIINLNQEEVFMKDEFERNKKKEVLIHENKDQKIKELKNQNGIINLSEEELFLRNEFERNKKKEVLIHENKNQKVKRSKNKNQISNLNQEQEKNDFKRGKEKEFILHENKVQKIKEPKEQNEIINLSPEEFFMKNEFERNKKKEIFIYDNNDQKINESNDEDKIINVNEEEFFLGNEFERNKKKKVLIHENKDQKLKKSKGKNEIINLNQEFLLKNDFERNKEKEFILNERNSQKIKRLKDKNEIINLNQEEDFMKNEFERNKKKKTIVHENKDQKIKRPKNKNQISNFVKEEPLFKNEFEKNKRKAIVIHENVIIKNKNESNKDTLFEEKSKNIRNNKSQENKNEENLFFEDSVLGKIYLGENKSLKPQFQLTNSIKNQEFNSNIFEDISIDENKDKNFTFNLPENTNFNNNFDNLQNNFTTFISPKIQQIENNSMNYNNNTTFNSHYFQTTHKKIKRNIFKCQDNNQKDEINYMNTSKYFNDFSFNKSMQNLNKNTSIILDTSKFYFQTPIKKNESQTFPKIKTQSKINSFIEVNTDKLHDLTLNYHKDKTFFEQNKEDKIENMNTYLNTSKYFNDSKYNEPKKEKEKFIKSGNEKSIIFDTTFYFPSIKKDGNQLHQNQLTTKVINSKNFRELSESEITFDLFKPNQESTQKDNDHNLKFNFFESFVFNETKKSKVGEPFNELNHSEVNEKENNELFDETKIETKLNQENIFIMKQRLDFMPKGLSPILKETKILDVTLSPNSKKNLNNAIVKGFEEELHLVKWTDYIDKDSPKEFFDKLFSEKQKLLEREIPVLENNLQGTKKHIIYEEMIFNKDIFNTIEIIGQLDRKFIVAVSKTQLLLFDQHAVHERVRLEGLYQEYMIKSDSKYPKFKSIHCNKYPKINLSEQELIILEIYKHLFQSLGFEYEVYSTHALIKMIPQCLHKKNMQDHTDEFFSNFLESLLTEEIKIIKETGGIRSSIPHLLQYVMSTEACRGAIKFGHELNRDECEKHIKMLSKCQLPFQCAHGRPTLFPSLTLYNSNESNSKINLKNLFK